MYPGHTWVPTLAAILMLSATSAGPHDTPSTATTRSADSREMFRKVGRKFHRNVNDRPTNEADLDPKLGEVSPTSTKHSLTEFD